MKQQLLKVFFICMAVALLPLSAHAAGDVEINATNFPDDNFRNYLLYRFDNGDGKLTEDEIRNITYLAVREKKICSLQGIEYFTALTELDCEDNQLTSLDVSKNTALELLWCSGNQLTALDISNNTALIKLGFAYNQLTILDISKNTALTLLDCTGNQLTSLDVSERTTLLYLYCGRNQLTSLDVSKNTALKDLKCQSNKLTSLDVSKNTALTRIYCYNNLLTSLDVSKNTVLTELYCYCNQIKGTSMDNLISSLPTQEKAWLNVCFQSTDEGNVCTKKQVQAARKKGWIAYYGYEDEDHSEFWTEYEGSDDTSAINDIRTKAGKDASIYNLRGQRLTAPQKGINIIDGRKVVVK